MNTASPQQTPSKRDKLHRILIGMVVLLSVFIIACLCLTFFIVARNSPVQPRLRVLVHPDGQTVPGAVTPQDLEQAIRLTKDSGKNLLRQNPEAVRQNLDEMAQLLLSGRLVELASGTDCLLLESSGSMCRVQLTEGLQNGQTFWVLRQYIGRAYEEGGPTMGFCCASIYIRYLVTAAVCRLGIYSLKLKGVFLQVVLFIIGMILLNMLWVRIAMLWAF
ncbi:MAG: hypothetical protein L0Y36_04655 [Planctomycetales bacterium]|nr:hypothetical protein [Planctomycetales bacterium]